MGVGGISGRFISFFFNSILFSSLFLYGCVRGQVDLAWTAA